MIKFFETVENNTTEYMQRIIAMESSNAKSSLAIFPLIDKDFFPSYFIKDATNRLSNEVENIGDIETFYTKIYTSPLINRVPTSIPIFDIDEIRDIKPGYIRQFCDSIPKLIDDSINNRMQSQKILKYVSGDYAQVIKNQVVDSNLPKYIKDKDLINLDNRQVYTVDSNFISTTILPSIRLSKVKSKDILKESIDLQTTTANCISDIKDYINTFNKIIEKKNVDSSAIKKTTNLLNGLIITFIKVIRYAYMCLLRKINLYTGNLLEFRKLYDTLLRYFPDGENIMHESVLDGKNDFRDEDIVHDLINGNSDFLISVNERITRYFQDMIDTKEAENKKNLYNPNQEYSNVVYTSITQMLSTINTSLNLFYELLHDPDLSIKDIKEKSFLDSPFVDNFTDTISKISNIDYYTAYTDAKDVDVYSSILNEMKNTENTVRNYGKIAMGLYHKIINIKKSVSQNVNNEFENIERNKETLELIDVIDRDYRSFLLATFRELLNRYSNIETELCEREPEQEYDTIYNDTNDYMSYANECVASIIEESNKFVLESALSTLKKELFLNDLQTKTYFEADDGQQNKPTVNDQGNNNTQTPNNANTNTNNGNNNSDSTKPTVNDNSNTNQNQNNGSNNGNNTGEKSGNLLKSLQDKILKFLNLIKDKLSKNTAINKKNLEWLKNNKQALTTRSYTNVSVNILPYIDKDPFTTTDAVLGYFRGGAWVNDLDRMTNNMFASVGISSVKMDNKDASLGDKLTQALKIGSSPLKTVTYSNGELASQIPKMIQYCENYYTNILKNTDKLTIDSETLIKEIQKNSEFSTTADVINRITSNYTTYVGAVTNAARDKANDYMQVLNSLVPKNANTNNANNQQTNTNQNNNEQQQNDNNQNSDNK